MKVLFICNGHLDSGLELFSQLQKIIEIQLVIQIEGNRLTQSIFDIDISNISFGFHPIKSLNNELKSEIIRLFNIDIEKIYILKYNSLSFKDFQNLRISKLFSDWVRINNFEIVHYYGSSLTWLQQAIFLRKIKKIFTIHDYILHTGDYGGTGYQYKFYMKIITKLKNAYYLLLSKQMMFEFLDYYKVKPKYCEYIYFGPFESYLKFSKNETNYEPYNILFFGRIAPYKGIEYLVDATKLLSKEMPRIKTIIAGGGKFYFDIKGIKTSTNFEIHNYYINNYLLAELITKSSIVICPYIDATQSGVVMTAYAFNKPVIATEVGAFKEYVINNVTGLLVPPKNSAKLAEAIKNLIHNHELYNNMIKNISEFKKNKFNWKNSAYKLVQFYKNIYENPFSF